MDSNQVNNVNKSLKCPGCGCIIQFDKPDELGYLDFEVYQKRSENFLCERCYRLKHYNEVKVIKHEKDIDFNKIFLEVSKNKNLLVYIVDAFDLTGSVLPNINELFPNSKILVIANKYDLFMRSNRPTKLRKYIKEYLQTKDVSFDELLVTSSIEDRTIKPITDAINKLSIKNGKVIFVGISNVGKSTLINTLSKDSDNPLSFTTSNQVGTTLGLTPFEIGNISGYDTPGYYNVNQLTYYLDKKSLNLVMPKKFIKPRTYQLYSNDTIFINGICGICYTGEAKIGASFYVANTLMLYRTKSDMVTYFSEKNDTFTVPNEKEKDRLGNMKLSKVILKADEELAISGVGFVSYNNDVELLIYIYEKIAFEVRKAMI